MLLKQIQEILPTLRANARDAEDNAQVPQENIDLLKTLGFFRALQPKRFGGLELDISEYTECVITLAEGCASTAWACSLLANHSHGLALFSEQAQNDVWGENPDTLASSSVAPLGKHTKTDGGIMLSGNFGWSSGCDYADWAVLGYMGENQLGQPGPMFALVPRSDYTILNDWDSAALSGTGSKTIVVKDAFVPDYRCESLFALNVGLARGFGVHSAGLYSLPFSPIFSLGFAAVALGIARRACDLYKEKTANRVRAYTGAKVAESAPAYMRLAESVNQVDAARELLRKDWREMMSFAQAHKIPPPGDVLNWRVHQSYSTKMAIEAVDRLFAAAGGGSWFKSNEMQRLFRDVHICGSHAQTDFDMAAQTYGRHLMGLPMDGKSY